ncbi:hypothetical protein EDB89DRAFT_2077610 [Lactarius sanguifluus]|nr:hypothetical protein EDB89DRAFT_2077610 [Lactarius sanguifluus]
MARRGGVAIGMSFIDATGPGTATSLPITNVPLPAHAHIATLLGTPTGKLRDNTVTEAAAPRAPPIMVPPPGV